MLKHNGDSIVRENHTARLLVFNKWFASIETEHFFFVFHKVNMNIVNDIQKNKSSRRG